MEEIILSRHGESVAIAEGIENGDPDTDEGLTDRGREQARELGRQIGHDPLDLCVVSQFPRVQQTAHLATLGLDITRLMDPNLNDIRYGEFEGQPKQRYMDWLKAHAWTTPLPGGESRVQVVARLCTAIERIFDRPERHVLVVTHELQISDLLLAIRGRPPAQVHGDIPFAAPYRLAAADVARGVTFLRSFLERLI